MPTAKQVPPGLDECDRYAIAVVDTLRGDFPDLRRNDVAQIVRDWVYRNAHALCGSELIVDDLFSARWRLVPAARDKRRARLRCWKQRPLSATDREREDRLNAALDELEM